MNPILLVFLSPVVIGPIVKVLISLIKRFPVVSSIENQTKRNLLFRTLALLLSLGGILGGFVLTGTVPDITNVSDILVTLALTVSALLSSFGTHEIAKASS